MEIEKQTASEDAMAVRSEVEGPLSGRRLAAPAGIAARATAAAPTRPDSLLVVLWRSRWLVLICLLAAVDGGIAYLHYVTPIYTSTAKLYLDYAGIRISNSYDPTGRPQTDKYLCTQAELIKSRPILTAVQDALTPLRLRTLVDADAPTTYLQRNMTVEIGKRDEVISVSLRSPHAAEAAQIVNCVVDTYFASRSEREQHNCAQVLSVLQEDLSRTRQELGDKQNQLTRFRQDQMPLALGSDQANGATQRYLELQSAHTQAQIKTAAAESLRRAIHTLAADPLGLRQYVQLSSNLGAYITGDQEKAALEARIIDLKHQKETLLKTVTAGWPSVVALSTEIGQIETKLKDMDDRFVRAVIAAAEQQYAEAKKNEAQIAQWCSQQEKQVTLSNVEVTQYQSLRAEVEYLMGHSRTVEDQVREIGKMMGEDMGQLRMAILERALPAALPSEPQKARVMAMALILGLLLGGAVAVLRDWLDQTLRSADEIAALLRVPVLGAIPAMSRRKRMPDRGRRVFLQPDSREAEAYRTVRTAVLFGAAPEGAKTLLITSPAAGDGKSTLVSNLAIALASAGQKTLILDADFRKPMQHAIFGLDPHERCLSDVFAGVMTLTAAVQPTGIEGLHVLTGGYRIPNPAEVLNSRQFAQLLTCLTEVYERIVIDAPPVTAVTDAQILGALCDATVLVLRADKSSKSVAVHAIDALHSVGARLLGVVVNEVRKSGYRYGYYHDRYHKYYSSHAKRSKAGKATSPAPAAALCVEAAPPDAQALAVRTASGGA
jgi:capsular exopolysaccharide synthesis family protein